MMKWECTVCEKVHRSNPEECKSCGHTILQPYGASNNSSTSSTSSSSRNANGWVCSKCMHFHSRKPFTCDECGSNTIRKAPEVVSTVRAEEDGSLAVSLFFWAAVLTVTYLFIDYVLI